MNKYVTNQMYQTGNNCRIQVVGNGCSLYDSFSYSICLKFFIKNVEDRGNPAQAKKSILRAGFVTPDPFTGISFSSLFLSFELQTDITLCLCPSIPPNQVPVPSLLFTCCMAWPLSAFADTWKLRSHVLFYLKAADWTI